MKDYLTKTIGLVKKNDKNNKNRFTLPPEFDMILKKSNEDLHSMYNGIYEYDFVDFTDKYVNVDVLQINEKKKSLLKRKWLNIVTELEEIKETI